ncbi:MAG: signal recognition particle-docking protein FtsY [Thermodesulfobacteriota bacterium]
MGFFSKISKIWRKSDEDAAPKSTQTATEHTETAPASPAESLSTAQAPWQSELLTSLQEAEPRLSVWLDLILKDVHAPGPELWQRLAFFLDNLEVPKEEAETFIQDFRNWLEEMEYERVEEFRSELQYRLALALDLEDEEDERNRLFLKLSTGLSKTKEQLSKRVDQLLQHSTQYDAEFWDELEEILITSDVGFQAATTLIERLKERVRQEGGTETEVFKALFQEELAALFPQPAKRIKPQPPEVVLMIGVNGVGKTTTIAKLAHRAHMQGQKVMVAAGDTFRAAAIEQLEIWSQRVGAGFYAKAPFSDPASVAYEALDKAQHEHYDTLFVDTAGRLHTNVDLMEELRKIKRVLAKKHPGAPHRTILVLDATTGQNALSQTKLFAKDMDIDEIVLTKLDGTAKGGVVVAVSLEYKIPITFIGLGEKMEDLRPFSGKDFAHALLG